MSPTPEIGSIGWIDLTVDDAPAVRDFYSEVIGWTSSEVSMGDYSDFNMQPPEGEPVAGICHARGSNVGLPAYWLMYVVVADLDRSLERVQALGGEVTVGPKGFGASARYAVIRDPAGAVCALYQPFSG